VAASLQLSAATYSVAQNAGSLTVTVTRTGNVGAAVGVSYTTVAGTAVAGTNYTNATGTLQWAANDATAKTFAVAISNSPTITSSLSFKVGLSTPTGGVTVGSPATAIVTITPSGASSGGNAAALESYLSGLNKGTGQRVLSGQHADIWNSDSTSSTQPMDVVTPDVSQTGVNPAILGLVLNYATNSYAYDVNVTNTLANQWWSKGGLVMLSLYSNDPTFSYNTSGQPEAKSIPSSGFHQLTDHTSAAYKQWHTQLDTYAAALHTLTDSGHVVLFRPFIELNGNWNWYGAENSADFIAVWKDMHDYMMNTKGLKNVLWIYNVNAQNGGYMDYYPGADYVDIVGMDIYDDPSKIVADVNEGNMYSELVASGKPLIFPEIGLAKSGTAAKDSLDNTAIIKNIKASLPNVVGFLDWNGAIAICNQSNASALLNDPWVINMSTMTSSTSGT